MGAERLTEGERGGGEEGEVHRKEGKGREPAVTTRE